MEMVGGFVWRFAVWNAHAAQISRFHDCRPVDDHGWNLLKPLNYPKAEELVALHQVAPGVEGLGDFENGLLLSPSMYFTYAEQNRTFQSLGVWTKDISNVTGLAEPEQVRAVVVSDGVLQALGAAPQVGRWLMPADQAPRGPQRVMLGYGYWQRR